MNYHNYSTAVGNLPLSWEEIAHLLDVRGDEQQDLFHRAVQARNAVYENRIVVRGLIEITNLCRVNCEFCPMRRDNTKENSSFILSEDKILEAARTIKAHGLDVVFMQAGEIPQTTKLAGKVIPKIRDMFDDEVEILLNLGNKTREEYAYFKEQGANSYIIKHETSDPELNASLRHSSFEERLQCIRDLVDLGFKVGTGTIIDLPGQTRESVINDIFLALELGTHMISASPFIPAPDTPLENEPPGDVDLTLNFIAISRIMNPHWLVPAVSALEKRGQGGQVNGLLAGANVLTSNFTPSQEQNKYLIYGKKRFVVDFEHLENVLKSAGLVRGASVFR